MTRNVGRDLAEANHLLQNSGGKTRIRGTALDVSDTRDHGGHSLYDICGHDQIPTLIEGTAPKIPDEILGTPRFAMGTKIKELIRYMEGLLMGLKKPTYRSPQPTSAVHG